MLFYGGNLQTAGIWRHEDETQDYSWTIPPHLVQVNHPAGMQAAKCFSSTGNAFLASVDTGQRPSHQKSKMLRPVVISSSPSGLVTGGSARERQPLRSHSRQAGPMATGSWPDEAD